MGKIWSCVKNVVKKIWSWIENRVAYVPPAKGIDVEHINAFVDTVLLFLQEQIVLGFVIYKNGQTNFSSIDSIITFSFLFAIVIGYDIFLIKYLFISRKGEFPY